MKLFKNFSFFLIGTVFVISCAPTAFEQVSQRERELKTRGGYSSYLALEYLEYSRNLAIVEDKKRSKHFAEKALDLVNGKAVFPENPFSWDPSPDQVELMLMMQKRLERVLNYPRLKFYLPIQLAHLSYLYDCWISRESTIDFRADELAQCRVRFTKLLDEVETYIEDSKKDREPKTIIKEPEFTRFEIFFDFNSFKLNDKSAKKLISTLEYIKSLEGDYHILLVGNADRSGKRLYNENLSFRRATTIKNYLIKNGISKDLIEMRSKGEDFLNIITKDGVKQQLNRVVGIYVMKGGGSFASYPLPLIENYIYLKEIEEARKKRGL